MRIEVMQIRNSLLLLTVVSYWTGAFGLLPPLDVCINATTTIAPYAITFTNDTFDVCLETTTTSTSIYTSSTTSSSVKTSATSSTTPSTVAPLSTTSVESSTLVVCANQTYTTIAPSTTTTPEEEERFWVCLNETSTTTSSTTSASVSTSSNSTETTTPPRVLSTFTPLPEIIYDNETILICPENTTTSIGTTSVFSTTISTAITTLSISSTAGVTTSQLKATTPGVTPPPTFITCLNETTTTTATTAQTTTVQNSTSTTPQPNDTTTRIDTTISSTKYTSPSSATKSSSGSTATPVEVTTRIDWPPPATITLCDNSTTTPETTTTYYPPSTTKALTSTRISSSSPTGMSKTTTLIPFSNFTVKRQSTTTQTLETTTKNFTPTSETVSTTIEVSTSTLRSTSILASSSTSSSPATTPAVSTTVRKSTTVATTAEKTSEPTSKKSASSTTTIGPLSTGTCSRASIPSQFSAVPPIQDSYNGNETVTVTMSCSPGEQASHDPATLFCLGNSTWYHELECVPAPTGNPPNFTDCQGSSKGVLIGSDCCYLFHRHAASQSNAVASCQPFGRLAIIANQNVLSSLKSTMISENIWMKTYWLHLEQNNIPTPTSSTDNWWWGHQEYPFDWPSGMGWADDGSAFIETGKEQFGVLKYTGIADDSDGGGGHRPLCQYESIPGACPTPESPASVPTTTIVSKTTTSLSTTVKHTTSSLQTTTLQASSSVTTAVTTTAPKTSTYTSTVVQTSTSSTQSTTETRKETTTTYLTTTKTMSTTSSSTPTSPLGSTSVTKERTSTKEPRTTTEVDTTFKKDTTTTMLETTSKLGKTTTEKVSTTEKQSTKQATTKIDTTSTTIKTSTVPYTTTTVRDTSTTEPVTSTRKETTTSTTTSTQRPTSTAKLTSTQKDSTVQQSSTTEKITTTLKASTTSESPTTTLVDTTTTKKATTTTTAKPTSTQKTTEEPATTKLSTKQPTTTTVIPSTSIIISTTSTLPSTTGRISSTTSLSSTGLQTTERTSTTPPQPSTSVPISTSTIASISASISSSLLSSSSLPISSSNIVASTSPTELSTTTTKLTSTPDLTSSSSTPMPSTTTLADTTTTLADTTTIKTTTKPQTSSIMSSSFETTSAETSTMQPTSISTARTTSTEVTTEKATTTETTMYLSTAETTADLSSVPETTTDQFSTMKPTSWDQYETLESETTLLGDTELNTTPKFTTERKETLPDLSFLSLSESSVRAETTSILELKSQSDSYTTLEVASTEYSETTELFTEPPTTEITLEESTSESFETISELDASMFDSTHQTTEEEIAYTTSDAWSTAQDETTPRSTESLTDASITSESTVAEEKQSGESAQTEKPKPSEPVRSQDTTSVDIEGSSDTTKTKQEGGPTTKLTEPTKKPETAPPQPEKVKTSTSSTQGTPPTPGPTGLRINDKAEKALEKLIGEPLSPFILDELQKGNDEELIRHLENNNIRPTIKEWDQFKQDYDDQDVPTELKDTLLPWDDKTLPKDAVNRLSELLNNKTIPEDVLDDIEAGNDSALLKWIDKNGIRFPPDQFSKFLAEAPLEGVPDHTTEALKKFLDKRYSPDTIKELENYLNKTLPERAIKGLENGDDQPLMDWLESDNVRHKCDALDILLKNGPKKGLPSETLKKLEKWDKKTFCYDAVDELNKLTNEKIPEEVLDEIEAGDEEALVRWMDKEGLRTSPQRIEAYKAKIQELNLPKKIPAELTQFQDGKMTVDAVIELNAFAGRKVPKKVLEKAEKGDTYPFIGWLESGDKIPSNSALDRLRREGPKTGIPPDLIPKVEIWHIEKTTSSTSTPDPQFTTRKLAPGETTTPVYPLEGSAKAAVTVMQTMGCAVLIAVLVGTLVVYGLVVRDDSIERFLHMNQELALLLGHILVLTMRDQTTLPIPCKLASIGLQWMFTAVFAFMALEGLQAYTIGTSIIGSGGLLNYKQNAVAGWALSGILTGVSAMFFHSRYVSAWSCWLNMGHTVAATTAGPIGVLSCITIIMAEAGSMGEYPALPGASVAQRIAAIANTKGLLFVVPANVASWFIGLWAVYYANVALYGTVFALNTTLAVCIFIFHTLGNPKVYSMLSKCLGRG